MRISYPRLMLLWLAGTIVVLAQTSTEAIITGKVVRADTGEAIGGANVYFSYGTNLIQPTEQQVLMGAGRSRPSTLQGTTTRADGHFRLGPLKPGAYRLLATASGYVNREYGQENYHRPGILVNVGPAEQKGELVLALTRTASIGGIVRNIDGQPVQGMAVTVTRPSYNVEGQRILESVATVRAGANGQYRFDDLLPTRYYLVARPPGKLPTIPNSDSTKSSVAIYSTTFAPSSADPESAAFVDLRSGQEYLVDITMRGGQELKRVRGRLLNPVTGKWPTRASITYDEWLIPTGASISGGGPESYNAADGTFEFRDVEPGVFLVKATTRSPLLGNQSSPLDEFVAGLGVTVQETDVDDLVLSPLRLESLQGRMRVLGRPTTSVNSSLPDASRLRLLLRPTAMAGSVVLAPPLVVDVAADGAVRVSPRGSPEVLILGQYRVITNSLPQGYYLAQVQLNGTDITERPFQFSAVGANMLEFLISPDGGHIDVTVRDERRQLVSDADVALIPYRQLESVSRYRAGRTSSNGQLSISGIPPGEYQLFAWDGIEEFGYFDPALRSRSESDSRRVIVSPGQRYNYDLKVIRSDPKP